MSTGTIEAFPYKNLTSSGNVLAGRGKLAGIFCATASSTPTIAVFDTAATSTTITIVAAFVPVAGTFYPIPALASTGIYVQLGGTVNCTPFFEGA